MWRILDDLLFRPKKAIKIILLIAGLVVVLVLAANAVVDPDRTLVFEEKMVLNYGSEDNTISLIKTIGGKDVKKEDINKEKNSISMGNWQVWADTVDTTKIGKYNIAYQTSDNSSVKITKMVEVADIEGPTITARFEKPPVVNLSEIGDLKPSDLVYVTDNLSRGEGIKVEFETDINSIVKGGTHTVSVVCSDEVGNTTKMDITVSVFDDIEAKRLEEEEKAKQEQEKREQEAKAAEEKAKQEAEAQANSAPAQTPSGNGGTNSYSNNNYYEPEPYTPPQTIVPDTSLNRSFSVYDYGEDIDAMVAAMESYGGSIVAQGLANGYNLDVVGPQGWITFY